MKDIKFKIQFSILLTLIVVALYILNFVSFNTKSNKENNFLTTLASIECEVSDFNIIKKKYIPKVEVVVVEKKVYVTQPKKSIAKNEIDENEFEKLKQKFYKTNDYKVAIKLSRLFYTSKRYKKALKWSMIANELNKKDDKSWILFAKAKLKLGDKKVAKMALKSYQKVYNSKEVKKLLSRISS